MNRIRARQAAALRGATVRSVWWPPALVAALLAACLVLWRDDALAAPGTALRLLRTIAVLLAVGAAFVLDDDAGVTVASSPTPLWWRRALRYVTAVAVVLPAWAGVLAYAGARRPELPVARLTLELAALVILGFAFAAATIRWWGVPDPGLGAALAIGGVTLAAALAPASLQVFTTPGSASWQPSTIRWAVLLLVAITVLVAATRDPAVRSLARRTA
jgi:hypothetical protein